MLTWYCPEKVRTAAAIANQRQPRLFAFRRTISGRRTMSLDLGNLGILDDFGPFLQLGVDPLGELIRSIGNRYETERGELFGHIGRCNDSCDVALPLVDDGTRSPGRDDNAGQCVGLLIGYAC